MTNKRRGFTLIEMIGVIGVVIIIFSISATSYLYYRKVTEDLVNEDFIYGVEELLLYGKKYSIKKSANLSLNIDNTNKYIGLVQDGKVVKKLLYSEGIKLESSSGTIIRLDSNGRISPGTIKINKSNDILATIKIRVGVDYINVERK